METLPLILAVLVPPLVAVVRKFAGDSIPSKFIPIILPVAGGVVAGLASFLGVDIAGFVAGDASTWGSAITGILIGAAAVGVHQISKQKDKPS